MPFGARSSAGSSMRHMSTSEALFRDRQDAKAAKRYAEEIIRNDKKAQSSKSLKELLREQEEMRRAGEEQRRMATDQGRTQAQKVCARLRIHFVLSSSRTLNACCWKGEAGGAHFIRPRSTNNPIQLMTFRIVVLQYKSFQMLIDNFSDNTI